jgi:multidrug efflux pump subunit AcrB
MLFEFNKIWKTIALVGTFWIIYGFWGFELTMVTLVALLLSQGITSTNQDG